MREEEDNIIGYIEYLSDDGKIIGYVTPFTDVDKFRKEILKAAEVGMPITPVVFPDKLDKSLGLPRDIYWPGGFRKEKRHTYPYEIYQTNNRNFVFRNYAYAYRKGSKRRALQQSEIFAVDAHSLVLCQGFGCKASYKQQREKHIRCGPRTVAYTAGKI